MTYVVTENCIRCKFMDCVEVCPVDCFYAGENFLVINPDECIDCGVCEPECPAEAIFPDSDDRATAWAELNASYASKWPNITRKGTPPADAELNASYASKWPNITRKGTPPADADDWKDKPDKAGLLSPEPHKA